MLDRATTIRSIPVMDELKDDRLTLVGLLFESSSALRTQLDHRLTEDVDLPAAVVRAADPAGPLARPPPAHERPRRPDRADAQRADPGHRPPRRRRPRRARAVPRRRAGGLRRAHPRGLRTHHPRGGASPRARRGGVHPRLGRRRAGRSCSSCSTRSATTSTRRRPPPCRPRPPSDGPQNVRGRCGCATAPPLRRRPWASATGGKRRTSTSSRPSDSIRRSSPCSAAWSSMGPLSTVSTGSTLAANASSRTPSPGCGSTGHARGPRRGSSSHLCASPLGGSVFAVSSPCGLAVVTRDG